MIIFVGSKKPDTDGFYPRIFFNTDVATGADYVTFIANFMELITKDQAAMERMANAEGKTTQHSFYGAVGAIAIKPE